MAGRAGKGGGTHQLGCSFPSKACPFNPEIQASSQSFLEAKDLRHPLLQEERAVGNAFSLRQRVCVITGSNMSGKTTFLRSIGTNLVLAYAGGVVAAEYFRASPMAVCTSIRVEDSVSQGISSFYAELLREEDDRPKPNGRAYDRIDRRDLSGDQFPRPNYRCAGNHSKIGAVQCADAGDHP